MARKLPWLTTSIVPPSTTKPKRFAAAQSSRQHHHLSRYQSENNDDGTDLDHNHASGNKPNSTLYKSTGAAKRRRTSPLPASSPLEPSSPISPSQQLPSNTSLTTALPMMSGYDQDDIYMMVEDEFQSVAQEFTRHLHRAEYRRLRARAKEAKALRGRNHVEDGEGGWMAGRRGDGDIGNAAAATGIGEMRLETKLALKSGALRAKQGHALDKTLVGGSMFSTPPNAAGAGVAGTSADALLSDTEEDGSDYEGKNDHRRNNGNRPDTARHNKSFKGKNKDKNIEEPWAGTSLATLMSGASPSRKALVGLQAIPSSTKAARGFVRHDETSTGSEDRGNLEKDAEGGDDLDRESDDEDDDGRAPMPPISNSLGHGREIASGRRVSVRIPDGRSANDNGATGEDRGLSTLTSTTVTTPYISSGHSKGKASSSVSKPKNQSITSTKYSLLSNDYTRNLLAELDKYDEADNITKSNPQPVAEAEASEPITKLRNDLHSKQETSRHDQVQGDEEDGRQRFSDIPLFLA